MRKLLFLLIAFTSLGFAQERFKNNENAYTNWSVQLFGGLPYVYSADLESPDLLPTDHDFWNVGLGLTHHLNHVFGVQLYGSMGETFQQANSYGNGIIGVTEYQMVSLLGDINISQLMRRKDLEAEIMKLALHTYVGLGWMNYNTKTYEYVTRGSEFVNHINTYDIENNFAFQLGVGLKYRLSDLLDLELRVMNTHPRDEEFDGSDRVGGSADIDEDKDDEMVSVDLGVHFKLGDRSKPQLDWVNPNATSEPVCTKDEDKDGVCDDWDKQLDTPIGARVDGAGVAMDTDLDGVIDLNDQCVTVPGDVSNNGCPVQQAAPTLEDQLTTINKSLEGIQFDVNKADIKPQYYNILDNAAKLITSSGGVFTIEGHTDASGSADYNMNLSRKRAQSVKTYLVNNFSIDSSKLMVVAKGESDLKFPECQPAVKCDDYKNYMNRRIVFISN